MCFDTISEHMFWYDIYTKPKFYTAKKIQKLSMSMRKLTVHSLPIALENMLNKSARNCSINTKLLNKKNTYITSK